MTRPTVMDSREGMFQPPPTPPPVSGEEKELRLLTDHSTLTVECKAAGRFESIGRVSIDWPYLYRLAVSLSIGRVSI